jgi:hypothetical protein
LYQSARLVMKSLRFHRTIPVRFSSSIAISGLPGLRISGRMPTLSLRSSPRSNSRGVPRSWLWRKAICNRGPQP